MLLHTLSQACTQEGETSVTPSSDARCAVPGEAFQTEHRETGQGRKHAGVKSFVIVGGRLGIDHTHADMSTAAVIFVEINWLAGFVSYS